jgi:hypothetical protein
MVKQSGNDRGPVRCCRPFGLLGNGVRPNSPPQMIRVSSKETSLFQIFNQRCDRFICLRPLVCQAVSQAFSRTCAVEVPAPVEQLHKANTLFDQSSSQQAVVRKAGFARHRAVFFLSLFRFFD